MKPLTPNHQLFQLHLLGHCIFCLRRTTSKINSELVSGNLSTLDFELLEKVPRAELSPLTSPVQFLSTFNHIWPYLQQKGGVAAVTTEEEILKWKANKKTEFSRLPRMCQFCAEKVMAVDQLWRELAVRMKGLRDTMEESKYGGEFGWRAEGFERALNNSVLEEDSVRAVLEFLEIVEESPGVTETEGTSETGSREDDFFTCMESPTSADLPVSSSNTFYEVSDLSETTSAPPSPPKRAEKPRSLEGSDGPIKSTSRPLTCPPPRETYTSGENDTSFDEAAEEEEDEGEEADDESDPGYVKLEYEGLSSSEDDSDSDSEDDEDETRKTVTVKEDKEQGCLVAYQVLENKDQGLYRDWAGASFEVTANG